MLVHSLSEVRVHGWLHFHFTSQFSRYKISPSAMTVAGLWSARCGALPMSSPSIRTAASPASEHTCHPAWWTAWADSRRARGWKRSSKSWHLNKEDAVALFQACQAVLLAHHSMVNPLFLFHLPPALSGEPSLCVANTLVLQNASVLPAWHARVRFLNTIGDVDLKTSSSSFSVK